MARFSYEDAVNAVNLLDELGVTGGEARQEAMQEIIDKLGDNTFPDSIGGLGLGALERARNRDLDYEREQARKAKAKKAARDLKNLQQFADFVTDDSMGLTDKVNAMGFAEDDPRVQGLLKGPISSEEWLRIKSMYGK